MGQKVPEEELARLKREISIERLVRASGVELKKHGKNLVGKCLWHEDRTPSLIVTPENGLWHCMGACNVGGSVIDWVMRTQGVSFRHAVELLRSDDPLAHATPRLLKSRSSTVKLPPLFTGNESDEELLEIVARYYHETLLHTDTARAYMKKRGLDDEELWKHFGVGFCDRTLGYRMPAKPWRQGGELRGRLTKLGILRESGHEHLRGCITVPVRDRRGKLVQLYGRRIGALQREGDVKHLYLPRPLAGVFNFDGIVGQESIIFCEAIFDAMTFWVAGFRNVTCAFGVKGMSLEIMEALTKTGAKRAYIAYDRDDAGDKGVFDLVEGSLLEGFEAYRVLFPRGMDANEYALKVQPAAKSLELALKKAEWLGLVGGARTPDGRPAPLKTLAPPSNEGATTSSASTPASPEPSSTAAPSSTAPSSTKTAAAAASSRTPARAPAPATSGESVAEERREPLSLVVEEVPLPAAIDDEKGAAAPATPSLVEERGEEVHIKLGDRRFRVRGLQRNASFDVLKVNLLVQKGEAFFVDTLDLYSAKHRALFLREASAELATSEDALKKDLGKVLLILEQMQEKRLAEEDDDKDKTPELTPAERERALALLKDPRLVERILCDFDKIGVVGEETNKLVGYLAAVSRKLPRPLAVIIQSTSAAGKSSVMDAVLALVPDEERVKYSAMTGQSLFYMGETDLKHKILAIAEDEGAQKAGYALKLLQSEGEIAIASTAKDPDTGRLMTQDYRVQGPVMVFLTTTKNELDEELTNRCFKLTVNEGREQTRAIHEMQRRAQTLEGLYLEHEKPSIVKLHKDAQRLLQPVLVRNPYADELTFPDDKTRMRRDHMKYQTLINTIAFLHQYQRPRRSERMHGELIEYIDVTLSDIALANKLSHEVLGQSLDELSPQTRRVLTLLDEMVTKECARLEMERSAYRFTRRQALDFTGVGYTQLSIHMERLIRLEYVAVHRAGRGLGFVHELLYGGGGQDGRPSLRGLVDVDELASRTNDNLSGSKPDLSGRSRPDLGPISGRSRGPEIVKKLNGQAPLAAKERASSSERSNQAENEKPTAPSYTKKAAK